LWVVLRVLVLPSRQSTVMVLVLRVTFEMVMDLANDSNNPRFSLGGTCSQRAMTSARIGRA